MENVKNCAIETQCVHAGTKPDPNGAVVTPIYQTSTFKFKNADHGARLFAGEEQGYIYTRLGNPTVDAMEDAVATLEKGGYKAIGCGTGMAAVHTLVGSVVGAGDHIVASKAIYGCSAVLLQSIMPKFNIHTTFVDTENLEAVKAAIQPNTKLIFVETPGNPTIVISDIQEIAKIAKAAGAKLAIDNTFASPILQSPLELGADFVIHSMTKFLNGHADVVAGIIITKNEEDYNNCRHIMSHFGGTIDPFNSFLVHRGLKTLKIRVEQQQKNAQIIAEYLEKHPKVDKVVYPGLKSHPQYELGKKQMRGPGSMITFELKGGLEAGKKMMDSVKLVQLAVSLGGIESLIQHPASMTHAHMGAEARQAAGITDGLVRLAVGIENVNDIIADLEQSMK